jgi:uncharacterized membrane protein
MQAWARRGFVVLACAWPLALHAAVMAGHRAWLAGITATVAIVALVLWAAVARSKTAVATAGLAIAVVVAILASAPQLLLFSPPVVIPAFAAAAFAATLRRGREPAISRIARLERGPLPPDLARYTRALTWIWAALLIAIAVVSLVLALFGSLSDWSLFTNIVSYVLMAALFFGEYGYRRWHFPQYRHASLATLARNIRAGGVFRLR